jgi:peptidoglycan/LPS O-acetylase OafA/YrhL
MTLAEKFADSHGRPSGFDYMRITLALSVVFWHTVVITYGHDAQDAVWHTPHYRVLVMGILPAFFVLSGFLVAGSLERSKTLAGFMFLRVIRIFPALVLEITLSALILGPAMTHVPLSQYFGDTRFFTYFLNCIGDIHYALPGLFDFNPYPSITNEQLWTVPWELECYVALSILAFSGLAQRTRWFGGLICLVLLYGAYRFIHGSTLPEGPFGGRTLVLCFLMGVFLYLNRRWVPYNRWLGWLCVGTSLLCFWIPNGTLLAPFWVAYATVFLGLTNPPKPRFLDSGDYSYGIFLYGFPIQQAVVATGLLPANGWITCLAALPLIILVAIASWHLWEKRVLQLRVYRPTIDRMAGFTAPGAAELAIGAIVRRFGRKAAAGAKPVTASGPSAADL